MTTQFISPIQPMQSIQELKAAELQGNKTEGNIFSSIFENAMSDVVDTQKVLEQQQYLLATGQVSDPHSVTIAAAEAQMTVDLLVQLRNSAVEAYNEIMRMSV